MIQLLRPPILDEDGFSLFRCEEILAEEFQRFHELTFDTFARGENTNNDLLRGIAWGSYVNRKFAWTNRRTYILTAKENEEEMGNVRRFSPIPKKYLTRPEIEAVLHRTWRQFCFAESSYKRIYEVQVSGIRYAPTLAKPAMPAPIGPHRDRVDGAVLVVRRTPNLAGGQTRIYDPDDQPLYELDLADGEAVAMRDAKIRHQVTPLVLQPGPGWRPGCKAFRDILIVRFQPVGR